MQYPLGEHEREQIASKTGKKLDEITLDAVMRNQIAPDDIKISKETLYLIFDYPYKYYTFKHFEV